MIAEKKALGEHTLRRIVTTQQQVAAASGSAAAQCQGTSSGCRAQLQRTLQAATERWQAEAMPTEAEAMSAGAEPKAYKTKGGLAKATWKA